MPLALEGRIVAGLAQHVADSGKIGGHVGLEGIVGVVEHTGLGDVATRIDNRAAAGRHVGTGIVLLERGTYLAQPLAGGIVAASGVLLHVSLLIGGDEDDVVLAVAIGLRLVVGHRVVTILSATGQQCSTGG